MEKLEENKYSKNGLLTKYFNILMNYNFPDLKVNKKINILIYRNRFF